MTMVSFGDLAQSFLLKTQTTRLKSETGRITQELSSGRLADVAKSMSGDLGRLASLSRSHDLASGYLTAAQEASFRADAMQTVISTLSVNAKALAPGLLAASQNENAAQLDLYAAEGSDHLRSALAALNTNAAGQNLLSGVATDKIAVAPAATILGSLRAELVGATTATVAMSRISAWFDAPTGFAAVAYMGGGPIADHAVSPDDSVWLGATANDPSFRQALKGFAAAALINDPALTLGQSDMQAFALLAGEQMMTGQDALIHLAAKIGVSESRINTAQSRNSAEKLTLEIAMSDLVQSDPFTLATELEAVQTNLETLYAVTARLSRLNLTDFIR